MATKTKKKKSAVIIGEEEKGYCEVCKTLTTQICICSQVFYCSKKHEIQDYPSHKSKFLPFTVPMKRSLGGISAQPPSNASKGIIPLEDRYAVAREIIEPGTVLFKEAPILVAPNYTALEKDTRRMRKMAQSFCLGCMEDYDGVLSEDGKSVVYRTCSCKLPLCDTCRIEKDNNKHSQYECSAIIDASKNLGDVMNLKSKRPFENEDLIKDLTVLRAILLQKTNWSNWKAFINLKLNVRFTQSLRTTPESVKEWVKTKTPISENYIDNNSKDFFRLEDLKRIIALFSTVSVGNPRKRVLYNFISWMPQSCTPNSAIYMVKNTSPGENLEITVKTVERAFTNKEISINYITDLEGGLSKASVKLFSESAMICVCQDCKFSDFDTTVGVRCNSGTCMGYISPKAIRVEPGKSLLNVDVYSANRIWQCSVCKKHSRFQSIQNHVNNILKDLESNISAFEKRKNLETGLSLRTNLDSKLHKDHWLRLKLDKLLMQVLDSQIGFATDMLKIAVGKADKKTFMDLLEKKITIYFGAPGKTGFLHKICRMQGTCSEISGLYKFDAFYASFIQFMEKFKADFIENQKPERAKEKELRKKFKFGVYSDLKNIMSTLEDVCLSLSSSENPKYREYSKIAFDSVEAYNKVYKDTLGHHSKDMEDYLQDLLEIYAAHDSSVQSLLVQVAQKNKPTPKTIFGESQQIPMTFSRLNFDTTPEVPFFRSTFATSFSSFTSSSSSLGEEEDERFSYYQPMPRFFRSRYPFVDDDDDPYGGHGGGPSPNDCPLV